MFTAPFLHGLSKDITSPFFRHQVLSLLIRNLQHIYTVKKRTLDGMDVFARIDVRNALFDALQRCHNSVVPDADAIRNMADSLPVLKSPAAYLPISEQRLYPAWILSQVEPGSLPLSDVLDSIAPAVAFDHADDFLRVTFHLAIALRLITPHDIDRFYDYVKANMDGDTCAYILVERYRDTQCQAAFSAGPRCWDGVYDRLTHTAT